VVFGVMLTAQGPFINMRIGAGEWAIAAAAGLSFFSVLAYALFNFDLEMPADTVAPAMAAGPGVKAADPGTPPTRSLAASIVLGEALLGFENATPNAPLTGVRNLPAVVPTNETAPGRPNAPPPRSVPLPPRQRTKMAYLLPFEIVSVHLLVVLIGAAYLARGKRRRGAMP
jgi:NADH-quinone oxidoreductase subunit J